MTNDEHIAELQRLAYGANASAPVRARARAELAELAAAAGMDGGRQRASERDAGAQDAGAHPTDSEPIGMARHPPGPAERDATRSRAMRWGALAGITGLLLGAAAGSVVSRGIPSEPDFASAAIAPRAPSFGSGERAIPLRETDLTAMLDRPPTVADAGLPDQAVEGIEGIDPASVRLIATRADGLAAFIAGPADGADVCLIVLVAPHGSVQSGCTTGGMMPPGGLRVRHADPSQGSAVAILYASGTVTLGRVTGR